MARIYTLDDIIPTIRRELDYLGLKNVQVDRDASSQRLWFSFEKDGSDIRYNPDAVLVDIVGGIMEDLNNSDYMKSLRGHYEDKIEGLEAQILTLQKTNMEISEGLSNGIEYLEQLEKKDD